MSVEDISVEVVESLDELAQREREWHNLLQLALPNRDFWYRLPLLRATAAIHASGAQSPFILLAYHSGRLVGAMVLVLERKALTRAGVRVLSSWGGTGTALGVEGDIAVLPGSDGVVDAFAKALRGELARRFDVLHLGYVRADSHALPAMQLAFHEGHWSDESLSSLHVDLTTGFDAYRATRSGRRIRELNRQKKRLEADFGVEWVSTTTLSTAERDEVLQLHAARQQSFVQRGKLREQVSAQPRDRAAIDRVLTFAETHGLANHHLLRANGSLAAFLLTLRSGATSLAWLTAVDQQFTGYGAGTQILWHAVQQEFALGQTVRIEMGPGTTHAKDTVASHALMPQHLMWLPPASFMSRLRYHGWQRLVALRARLHRETPKPQARVES